MLKAAKYKGAKTWAVKNIRENSKMPKGAVRSPKGTKSSPRGRKHPEGC